MKRFYACFLLVAITCLVFFSCKDKVNHQDPTAVLKAFCQRLALKDIDGAAELATKNSAEVLEMMKYAMQASDEMETPSPNPVSEYTDLVFGNAVVDRNKATIPVTNKKINKTIDFLLEKESTGWKVEFGIKPGDIKTFDQEAKDSIEAEIEKALDSLPPATKP